MTNGTVTVCIHVPVFDKKPAVKKTENSREWNAASAPDRGGGTAAAPASAAASTTTSESTRRWRSNTCSSTLGSVVPHQRSLFSFGDVAIDDDVSFDRVVLDERSWVDVARNWLRGADELLDAVIERAEWHQGRRRMWDRMVDDPRLSCWYRDGDAFPHPACATIRDALCERYSASFGAVGFNYYRDGNDSVAPHADRELRELDDTLIAIVTLGARRPFLIRPKGGGRAIDVAPASGDLLVMGGACQAGWEHGVPKVARAGPRVSATWRWARRPGDARQGS
jgi:alkylated DNA repair dioxygenase AlkB